MPSSMVLVLGSGPIRIGQGIEFDYSCVHCVWALQRMGYKAAIVNNNPETVSTDFDTGDALYFEPVTLEDVTRITRRREILGAMVQFGGQTAINLAQGLEETGIRVLGTSPQAIATAEDRGQFEDLLESMKIPRPRGRGVRSLDEAIAAAKHVGYPVLVRPSFVLGGRAMEIVYDEAQLRDFYGEAESANPGQPVLVDEYLEGVEAEVDVISDGTVTLVPGVMEHVERAGVHSGDSMAVYPPIGLSADVQAQMVRTACDIARRIQVRGLMNIQFVIRDEKAYVLEVNPRASRTVPFLSKVTGIPMVDLATRCAMGETLAQLGYQGGLWILDPSAPAQIEAPDGSRPHAPGRIVPEADFRGDKAPNLPPGPLYAVKAPVFSFQKLTRVEPSLGPEMKSTGEIMGVDRTYEAALYKALIASGIHFDRKGAVLLTVRPQDRDAACQVARAVLAVGRRVLATRGTAHSLHEAGIACEVVNKISEGSPNLLDRVIHGDVGLMVNTPSNDRVAELEAARIRRACIESGVPAVTNIDTAMALVRAMEVFADPSRSSCLRLQTYFSPPVDSP